MIRTSSCIDFCTEIDLGRDAGREVTETYRAEPPEEYIP
jgi:hypothetical protein